jgi:hypothetical protein
VTGQSITTGADFVHPTYLDDPPDGGSQAHLRGHFGLRPWSPNASINGKAR